MHGRNDHWRAERHVLDDEGVFASGLERLPSIPISRGGRHGLRGLGLRGGIVGAGQALGFSSICQLWKGREASAHDCVPLVGRDAVTPVPEPNSTRKDTISGVDFGGARLIAAAVPNDLLMRSHARNVPYAHLLHKCLSHTSGRYNRAMSTLAERLVMAREGAGCTTAREGAERVGAIYDTYAQHENGTRGFRADTAQKYARALGVEAEWLLYGKGKPGRRGVPILGQVAAGAEGDFTDDFDMGAADDWLDPELTEGRIALRVTGDSMLPLAQSGDIAVFGPRHDNPGDMVNKRVMARLADGRKLFKVLRPGRKAGTFDLYSLNSAYDPIEDAKLEWVLPLERLHVR